MPTLRLAGITKQYGTMLALDRLDLTIRSGELVSLLGPSGCGKTTALRTVAGFERPDLGRVMLGDRDITSLPANRRDMGMVFQAYSLFPNLTARENIEFGLRLRKQSSAGRRKRADDLLALVGLSERGNRYAHQLSGGQQQRVALARALAIEPQVLLLDEPLSALDAKVREQLRDEIRRLQTEVGITTLFVTHDQEEALAISDRVGVMAHGRLEQLAEPAELYRRPATEFVASFVGLINRLPVELNGRAGVRYGDATLPVDTIDVPAGTTGGMLLVRPEVLRAALNDASGPVAGSSIDATVVTHSFLGPVARLVVRTPLGDQLTCDVPSREADEMRPGTEVALTFPPDGANVIARV